MSNKNENLFKGLLYRSVFSYVAIFLCIATANSLTASPGMGILCFILIGWIQYYLIQIMHESVHQFFMKDDQKSFAMACFSAFPLGLTRNYANNHLAHHKFFGSPDKDPDYRMYGHFPKSKTEFVAKLFYYFSSVAAFKEFFDKPRCDVNAVNYPGDFKYVVLFQLVFLSLGAYFFSIYAYLIYWLLPLVTVAKGLGYVRILAEHGDIDNDVKLRTFKDRSFVGRSLGPIGFCEHGYHHQNMGVNFLKLDDLLTHHPEKFENVEKNMLVLKTNHYAHLLHLFKKLPKRIRTSHDDV